MRAAAAKTPLETLNGTLAKAMEQGDSGVLILLFIILPFGLTLFCSVLEAAMALVLVNAPKLRLVKAALVSNSVGVILLFVGCLGTLALLTHANSQSRLPLAVVGLYIVPVAFAIWMKIRIFRSYISRQPRGRLPVLFISSHLLAATALYQTAQYYLEQ